MGILNEFFGGSDSDTAVKGTAEEVAKKAAFEAQQVIDSKPAAGMLDGRSAAGSLDQCYLLPMQTPLWDTEIYDPACKLNKMTFFVRPRGKPMLMATDAEIAAAFRGEGGKTEHDTCLTEPGILGYPNDFSILGFKFFVEPGSSHEDVAAITKGGLLKFGCSGRKEYLEIPLEALQYPMPSLPPEKLASDYERIKEILADPMFAGTKRATDPGDGGRLDKLSEFEEGAYNLARRLLGMEPCHRFNMGRSALKIKPGESFGMSLSWAEPPQTSRRLRLTAMIVGLWWKPL